MIGSDEQLSRFGEKLESMTLPPVDSDLTQSGVCLKQFVVTEDSPYKGKSIRESGIRDKYRCVVVGVERGKASLRNPDASTVFEVGDLVWIVGEEGNVYEVMEDGYKDYRL